MAKEFATVRSRLFPSTHRRISIRAAKATPKKLSIAEAVDEDERKARLFEKSVKAGKLLLK